MALFTGCHFVAAFLDFNGSSRNPQKAPNNHPNRPPPTFTAKMHIRTVFDTLFLLFGLSGVIIIGVQRNRHEHRWRYIALRVPPLQGSNNTFNNPIELHMKSFIKTSMIAIAVALVSVQASAIPPQENRKAPDREQRVQMRAKRIATEIALDDATASKFIDAYSNYHKEMRQLRSDNNNKNKEQRAKQRKRQHKEPLSNKSEEEIRQSITQKLDQSGKMLDLRKKYYAEYSKFLTQKQIARIYELDNQMPDHLKGKHPRK